MTKIQAFLSIVKGAIPAVVEMRSLVAKGEALALASIMAKASGTGDVILEVVSVSASKLDRTNKEIRRQVRRYLVDLGLKAVSLIGLVCLSLYWSLNLQMLVPATPASTFVMSCFATLFIWALALRDPPFQRDVDLVRQAAAQALTIWGIGRDAFYHTIVDIHGHLVGVQSVLYAEIGSVTVTADGDHLTISLHNRDGVSFASMNNSGANHARAIEIIRAKASEATESDANAKLG